jgi:hypothetical protein
MGHLGKQEPDIQSVILNNNTLASGQVIVFSEGVALSGIPNATLGPALVVIDPDTGEEKIWLHANGDISFGGNDDRTGFRENSGAQVDAYFKNVRAFYYNGNGINLGERRLDGYRARVLENTGGDFTVNSQDTGAAYDNVGSAGAAVTGLLPGPNVSEGHHYWFYNTTGDRMVIQPNANDAIITPDGALANGQIVALSGVGASVHLMANSQGNWMTLSQVGSVGPE